MAEEKRQDWQPDAPAEQEETRRIPVSDLEATQRFQPPSDAGDQEKAASAENAASPETTPDGVEDDKDWPTFDWQEGYSSWIEQDAPDGEVGHREAPKPEEVEPPVSKKKAKKEGGVASAILIALAYLFGVLLVSYGLATLGWNWANDVLALNKEAVTASITITDDETVEEIADALYDAGLIEYKTLFKIFASVTHKTDPGKIVAGTYELNTDMDYSALLTSIGPRSPVRETVKVTIPEGYTMEEIFALLEENGVCSVADLEEAAQNETLDYDFLNGVEVTGAARLEGYLFPDTYEFYKQATAKSVLTKLLDNFQSKFDAELEARLTELNMSKNDIMIIASIIEKETDGSDQRDISSVIYNRLAKGNTQTNGYLQMDSTIQYILSERKETLTEEDLNIESPYNTYLNAGLPIGCICCPGLDSIKAALYPNDTNYYYFALGNDGTTHFFQQYNSFLNFVNEQAATRSEE
jgi:UPF0755 protein